jgi:Na+/H+ antiporter NhaC
MILLILIIVTSLVFWALRLMDRAVENQEFSLMLAGFLVASSAAAIVGVYFLMSDYMTFITHAGSALDSYDTALMGGSEFPLWLDSIE